ncbi:uncharacterized protein EMH_0018650 [Eimeria mitis]|uniref:Uncharacterized protein n=1 Tax=Eimeria mitis TaxID=44415 RepID=U6KBA7_9EIME|nr:uncharacterized protein EMH_0018650 [Eimeria mitis]CDJ34081.1 hypothetical protein, conserved [Eimeria mitis]
MAMHECEAYWQEFLRRPKEQLLLREEQKHLQKETASCMAAQKAAKVAELERAIAGCSPEKQNLLRPIMKTPGLLERLHECLLQCEGNINLFSERIDKDQALSALIQEKADEFKRNPQTFISQEQQFKELQEEATRPLDAAEMQYLKTRKWTDLPQEELAERMSKGEICPREEWIPGISKGKRPLEGAALEEHLSFGDRLLREGREAYTAKNSELAFMRFKQGIELMNWVEAKDKQQQTRVEHIFSLFLKNAAQAAIQLGKYQEAIRMHFMSEPVVSELKELRSLADFDYRRLVIRCRKYLPEVQRPILQRHGVGEPSSSSSSNSSSSSSSSGDNHRYNMRLLEKSVSFWRVKDETIDELTKDCLKAVFGDVADIDI